MDEVHVYPQFRALSHAELPQHLAAGFDARHLALA